MGLGEISNGGGVTIFSEEDTQVTVNMASTKLIRAMAGWG